MNCRDELQEEIRELSPFLVNRLGKEEGFRVPKNYFKSLPDEVLERLREEMKPTPVHSSWQGRLADFFQNLWQPRLAWVLASVAILILTAVCIFNKHSLETAAGEQVALEDISDEAIHAYLSKNIEGVDNELLLPVTALENVEQKVKPLPKIAPKPSAEEVEKYLEENIEELDLEDLEEML